MDHFVSCDWGTTHFRLRLIEAKSLQVLNEFSSGDGVAPLSSTASVRQRPSTFENHLKKSVTALLRDHPQLKVSTCLVSGMATSSIGWKELPYAATPQPLDGSALVYEELNLVLAHDTKLRVLLVSGVKTSDEVMRGEEMELPRESVYGLE